jgi:hypothetical protein
LTSPAASFPCRRGPAQTGGKCDPSTLSLYSGVCVCLMFEFGRVSGHRCAGERSWESLHRCAGERSWESLLKSLRGGFLHAESTGVWRADESRYELCWWSCLRNKYGCLMTGIDLERHRRITGNIVLAQATISDVRDSSRSSNGKSRARRS